MIRFYPVPTQTVVDEFAGVARINLHRSGALSQEARASFSTRQGTAVPGVNYTETTGEIIFLPQETFKQIEIPILDDGIYTDAGSFQVELTAGPSSVIGEPGVHTVRIQDDDGPGEFQFRDDSSGAWESSLYTDIEVTRAKGRAGTVEVFYQTVDASAIAGTDYVAASGSIVFEPGVMKQWIRIQILDDDLFELRPNLEIQLTSASNGGTLGLRSTHVLGINDNDPEPVFWFPAATSTLREGEKYVAIPVARRGMAAQAWDIGYTVKSGTAEAPADFQAATGILHFEPTTTEATIFIRITNDDVVERDETFTVELTNPNHNYWLENAISRIPHKVTIIDDDTDYPEGDGTYIGIVKADGVYPLTPSGTITLTFTKTGRFSGVFRYQGASFPFRGGHIPFVGLQTGIEMGAWQKLDPVLTIQPHPDHARVEGTISQSHLPAMKFAADRTKRGTKDAPVAEAGRYTAVHGGGNFALEVGATGRSRMLGINSDGRGFAVGGIVDRNSHLSVVLPTARRSPRGFWTLSGAIDLLKSGPMNVGGELLTESGANLGVEGATYLPIATGRVLSDFDATSGAGIVYLSNLQGGAPRNLRWSERNQLSISSPPAGERWGLKVNPQTGLFRGQCEVLFPYRFIYQFQGICIQQPGELNDRMWGRVRFRGGDAVRGTGSISIVPGNP